MHPNMQCNISNDNHRILLTENESSDCKRDSRLDWKSDFKILDGLKNGMHDKYMYF